MDVVEKFCDDLQRKLTPRVERAMRKAIETDTPVEMDELLGVPIPARRLTSSKEIKEFLLRLVLDRRAGILARLPEGTVIYRRERTSTISIGVPAEGRPKVFTIHIGKKE